MNLSNNTGTYGNENLWKYFVYIGEGGSTSLANSFLFLTIIRYTALSDQTAYITLSGLIFADALNGLAYFICGIYRTLLVVSQRYGDLVSHWDCMLKPHNLIWAFSDTIASLMLLVISIDRFVSIASPLRYIGLPRKYSFSLLGFVYGYTVISGLYAIYVSYNLPDGKNWSAVCFTSMAIGPVYSRYLASFFIFGLLSIVGYIFVWISYYKSRSRVLPNNIGVQAKQQLRNQRKVTKSLGLSCIFTFILYVLPMFLNALSTEFDYSSTGLTAIPQYAFMWSNLNPLLNVFIFYHRHKEIRYAMRSLVMFKELPPDIRLWNIQQDTSRTQARSQRVQNAPNNNQNAMILL